MLLARRTKPPFQWSFPGGALEPGESAEAAAIREAREEISVEIEIVAKLGEREVAPAGMARRYVISVFAARLLSGTPQTGPEAAAIGWFHPAEIAALDATAGLAAFAEAAVHAVLRAQA